METATIYDKKKILDLYKIAQSGEFGVNNNENYSI